MKPIKMFVFAALAALMAMALVGASSVMAESTALCKEDTEACSIISHTHEVSVGKGKLLSSIVTIECEVLFLGDVISSENTGAPLEIKGNFTYPMAGCETTSGTLCEVTETSAYAIVKVLRLGHELADVTYEDEVNFHCGSLLNCTYNGVGLEGHALGSLLSSSLNGNVNVSDQTTNKTGGAFCPKTAKLDLTTTPLEHTYIGKEGKEEGAEKMVCIDVGAGNGFYLTGGNGTECGGEDKTRSGKYELGWVQSSIGRNEMACAFLGAGNGYYLARRWWPNNHECKDTHYPTRAGAYELGVTT